MASATLIAQTTTFVGNLDPNDPDKRKREAYDVEQYLADVESRIQDKECTTFKEMMKEAIALVDSGKGDAHEIMISTTFSDLTTFDEFKQLCRTIWKPKAYKDKIFNLQAPKNIKMTGSEFSYMTQVRAAIDRVVEDIKNNSNIKKTGKDNHNADIREIVTYVTYGNIYDALNEDYKRAFKKLDLDPRIELVVLMDNIMQKANEVKLKQDIVAHTETCSLGPEEKSERTLVTQSFQNKRSSNTYGSRGRSYNNAQNRRGYTYSSNRGQQRRRGYAYNKLGQRGSTSTSYGYNHRGQNGYSRGRGYTNQGNRGRPECRKCGYTNHQTSECLFCEYCERRGHTASHCYFKERDEARKQNQHDNKGH